MGSSLTIVEPIVPCPPPPFFFEYAKTSILLCRLHGKTCSVWQNNTQPISFLDKWCFECHDEMPCMLASLNWVDLHPHHRFFFFQFRFICQSFYNTCKFYFKYNQAINTNILSFKKCWTLSPPTPFVFTAAALAQLLQVLHSTLLLL